MAGQHNRLLTRQLMDVFENKTAQYKEGWLYRGRPLKFEPKVGQRQTCIHYKKDYGVLKDAVFMEVITPHIIRGEALIWDRGDKIECAYTGERSFTKELNDVLKEPARQIPIRPTDSPLSSFASSVPADKDLSYK